MTLYMSAYGLEPEDVAVTDRPQAEGAIERGRFRGSVDEEWGQSESLDPDNVGDIADEGAGHRG